jgi:hypothetical protein
MRDISAICHQAGLAGEPGSRLVARDVEKRDMSAENVSDGVVTQRMWNPQSQDSRAVGNGTLVFHTINLKVFCKLIKC